MNVPRSERLIIALDVPSAADAQEIVYELEDLICFYKVGLQLFTAEGPKIVSELVNSGRKVFLDLKLHDIPNTVAGAVKSAGELRASMLTIHASGGKRMMQAAVEAAAQGATPPQVLAVTVLTSLSEAELQETGVGVPLDQQVQNLAKLAQSAGCVGVVASPRETAALRNCLGSEMAIVVPGIRPAGSEAGDQTRIATPEAALRAGASHLVIGRPITAAKNRNHAAAEILAGIRAI